MITANELRIENYYDHNGEVRKVTPSTIEEVWNAERQWCKPIPLTEEWLRKFGFAKYDLSKNEFVRNSFRVCLSVRDEFVFADWDFAYVVIQYVHQLQNLYFALTQTELTLSNP
jgi:hypothetical protein